jgi:hypothetical protein
LQEHLSFIWNYFDEQSRAYSWLLRFPDTATEEKFQEGVMQALWERLNQQRWIKSNDNDREYVLRAFEGDVEMPDQSDDEDEEDEEGHEGTTGFLLARNLDQLILIVASETYDEDEEHDAPEKLSSADTAKNSELAVGYKSDRSFVVRGDKIGVFKHTANDGLGNSSPILKELRLIVSRVQHLYQSRQHSWWQDFCPCQGMIILSTAGRS